MPGVVRGSELLVPVFGEGAGLRELFAGADGVCEAWKRAYPSRLASSFRARAAAVSRLKLLAGGVWICLLPDLGAAAPGSPGELEEKMGLAPEP